MTLDADLTIGGAAGLVEALRACGFGVEARLQVRGLLPVGRIGHGDTLRAAG